MTLSRYSESRTLVRRLCRLPGEPPPAFRAKVARLSEHFERFNVDTAELCQWLMGLRPGRPGGDPATAEFWCFMLEPTLDGVEAAETQRDRWRLAVFDHLAGLRDVHELDGRPLPPQLAAAMSLPGVRPATATAERLFARLRTLAPAHRLVLLKSAAEWIVARYQRGVDNWERQHAAWEDEKWEWEQRHPELTAAVCERYTAVFKQLVWDKDKPPGVRNKRPRICLHERLAQWKDNCVYAGQKGHGPLCWKYAEFVKGQKESKSGFNEKFFPENADKYLLFRKRMDKRHALDQLGQRVPQSRPWFASAWTVYLRALGLNEETVQPHGRLPHCLKIGEVFEKSQCEWNPHTELCGQYRRALAQFDEATLRIEPLYREWRRSYLAGPRKPSFRYPSSRELPMPKVFGDRYHEIDFDCSVLRLRLDDMAEGESLEFGFTPWPRGYRPSRREVEGLVTSVHVNFVGRRARVGFRFEAPHAESGFACTQDELDELRSRTFPRQAQDQDFLDAARERLLASFEGGGGRDLRLLAVDLGETGACAAVYSGQKHEADVPLKINKVDRLYEARPNPAPPQAARPAGGSAEVGRYRTGVTKEHVGRHLVRLAEGAKQLAETRQPRQPLGALTLGRHDFRGLTRHVGWMIRDWVRHNAAQVIAAAEAHRCDLIAFESLRGFLAPRYDQPGDLGKKRWLAMFAYGRVRRKVIEKAVERGMRVVTLPYHKSSRFCSACGHEQENDGRWRKNKKQGKFQCECGGPVGAPAAASAGQPPSPPRSRRRCGCKAELDADANAARVLARVFWNEIRLPAATASADRG